MATEFVGIELQLRGYDGVMKDMEMLDSMLKGFRGQKNKIEIQNNLAKSKQELIAYRGELEKLLREQRNLEKGTDAWDKNAKEIQAVRDRIADCNQEIREMQYAVRNLSQTSFMQNFKRISSGVAHIGSAMQSAGNALSNLANPFQRFTSGVIMGAGYKALNSFTSGLEKGFDRYDVMKKYPKIMAAFGYSAEESNKSINELDKSVRGLPTGLDEMVDLTQRFTATTGDLTKGTKLAIATNNAFLASMSTDTQRYQGMMQLQDVLGGKDMNSREWNSLVSSMTPAIVKMGEYLQKTKQWDGTIGDFVQHVRDGKMANQDFVDTLIKVGSEGGAVAKMAQESKDTWQAFFANVGNAASRMVYGVLTSLDEVSQAVVGKDVNQFLSENVITGIDKMTASVKDWIHAHPEEITGFFKDLGRIDFKGFAKGFAEGLLDVAEGVRKLSDILDGRSLEIVGKFMAKAGMWGKFLTIGGGLIKGGRHIAGAIGAGGYEIVRAIRYGGLFGWLGKILGGKKAAETVTQTLPTITKASSSLVRLFKNTALLSGTVALPFATGFVSFKAFKSMMSDLKDTINIIDDIDWEKGKNVLLNMGGFFSAFGSISTLLGTGVGSKVGMGLLKGGSILSGLTVIFSGAFWADMKLIKGGFQSIKDTIDILDDSIKGVKEIKSISNIGDIKKNIKQAITSFNQIGDLLKLQDLDPKTNGGDTSGLKRISKSTVSNLENISDAVSTLLSVTDSLNKINAVELNTSNIEKITGEAGAAIHMISDIFTNLPESMKDKSAPKYAKSMQDSFSALNESFTSMMGKKGLLSRIPKITSQMQELVSGGALHNFKTFMERLGSALETTYNSLYSSSVNFAPLVANLESVKLALGKMKAVIKRLGEIGSAKTDTKGIKSGIKNIKNAITGIKDAFGTETIAELKGQIDTFVQSIKDALQSIKDLNETIEVDVEVKLAPGFKSSVRAVCNEIEKGKNQIRSKNSPISMTIPVSVIFSVTTNFASALAGILSKKRALKNQTNDTSGGGGSWGGGTGGGHASEVSTGGFIGGRGIVQYRAKGGSIFKPRGTDTVPAMLTPGEYVHRKKAVDTFGVDFMRRINQLDIRGAMDALMQKAGSMASVGRQMVINNNTYNNQSYTQNINTNSPAFAMKNASRFVGAL